MARLSSLAAKERLSPTIGPVRLYEGAARFRVAQGLPAQLRYPGPPLRDVKELHAGGLSGQDPSLPAPPLGSIRVKVLSPQWNREIA